MLVLWACCCAVLRTSEYSALCLQINRSTLSCENLVRSQPWPMGRWSSTAEPGAGSLVVWPSGHLVVIVSAAEKKDLISPGEYPPLGGAEIHSGAAKPGTLSGTELRGTRILSCGVMSYQDFGKGESPYLVGQRARFGAGT
jgi:hypothetical protein